MLNSLSLCIGMLVLTMRASTTTEGCCCWLPHYPCFRCWILRLVISYRVIIISWKILVSFRGFFFGRLYFCMVKYLSFHNSSICLKILFGKAPMWHTTCYILHFTSLRLLARYKKCSRTRVPETINCTSEIVASCSI